MFWQSTYGFLTKAIRPLSQELGVNLHIEWQERDSAAWGDYFLYPPFQVNNDGLPRETFKLYLNYTGFEGWKKPRFRNYGVLLLTNTERPLEIDKLLFAQVQGQVILVERKLLQE